MRRAETEPHPFARAVRVSLGRECYRAALESGRVRATEPSPGQPPAPIHNPYSDPGGQRPGHSPVPYPMCASVCRKRP